METLIPLLIAVILSALLSKKKKQRQGQSLPEERTTLPSSPWDDLIRELHQDKEQPEEQTAAPVPATVPEETEPTYYSYDEQAIQELGEIRDTLPFSYDNQTLEEAKPVSPLKPFPSRSGADVPDKEPKIERQEPVTGIFTDGFDPRMAVLYAEVMRPKFQEY